MFQTQAWKAREWGVFPQASSGDLVSLKGGEVSGTSDALTCEDGWKADSKSHSLRAGERFPQGGAVCALFLLANPWK